MSVRKLRAKQRGMKCNFCDAPAVWRGVYFTRFACAAHYEKLVDIDNEQQRRDAHQSEAEWELGI